MVEGVAKTLFCSQREPTSFLQRSGREPAWHDRFERMSDCQICRGEDWQKVCPLLDVLCFLMICIFNIYIYIFSPSVVVLRLFFIIIIKNGQPDIFFNTFSSSILVFTDTALRSPHQTQSISCTPTRKNKKMSGLVLLVGQ